MVPLGMVTSDTGGLEPLQARQIVTNFITSLQQTSEPVAPQEPQEWEALNASLHGTSELGYPLAADFAAAAGSVPRLGERYARRPARQAHARCATPPRRRLRRAGDREFVRLASRRALLEDIADSLGEEPETNPG
jgi:hypothetical protein